MRRQIVWMLVLAALIAGQAQSQEPGADKAAEMMKLWQKYRTPGGQHKRMAWFVGKWDVEIKLLMPGTPAQTSAGEAEFKWLVPDLFLGHELKGSLMGSPYHSFMMHGFDLYKKKWVTTGVNNFGSAMVRSEGVIVDPSGKVSVEYGTLDEFLTGEHDKPFKTVTRKQGDDKFTLEIWDLGIGPEGAAVMEFAYTRKK